MLFLCPAGKVHCGIAVAINDATATAGEYSIGQGEIGFDDTAC
jgi:hypothetical protein